MRTLQQYSLIFSAIFALAAISACGDDGNGNGGDIDASTVPLDDAGNPIVDAGPDVDAAIPAGCDMGPDATQCNNCIDDDGDGSIDGFDVHCISAQDDDEDSFATGISGDNMDMTWQDCFFDGNSGGGDDGCRYHYCCLLDGPCPNGGFDPVDDCQVSQECIDFCAPSAPPGCDCFGCCSICNDAGECFDVITNPAIAPDCDVDEAGNPVNCPACTLSEECGTPCDPQNCVLCPGQDINDLPPGCNNVECPNGGTSCVDNEDCVTAGLSNHFCSTGCCIPQIN